VSSIGATDDQPDPPAIDEGHRFRHALFKGERLVHGPPMPGKQQRGGFLSGSCGPYQRTIGGPHVESVHVRSPISFSFFFYF
jgi:hypothetical protein